MMIIGCDFHTRYQQTATTDERDAQLILNLLLTNRFPKIWVPTPADHDLRAGGRPFDTRG
jgi:hypothetical protein